MPAADEAISQPIPSDQTDSVVAFRPGAIVGHEFELGPSGMEGTESCPCGVVLAVAIDASEAGHDSICRYWLKSRGIDGIGDGTSDEELIAIARADLEYATGHPAASFLRG